MHGAAKAPFGDVAPRAGSFPRLHLIWWGLKMILKEELNPISSVILFAPMNLRPKERSREDSRRSQNQPGSRVCSEAATPNKRTLRTGICPACPSVFVHCSRHKHQHVSHSSHW
jgi:hypothetical protein